MSLTPSDQPKRGTDAELAREPGSQERRYEITFVDGSVLSVPLDDDHDVMPEGRDGSVIVYAPGRRTTFPAHRIRAVTLYGWDQEPE